MQVGDLVKMVGLIGTGILTLIENKTQRGQSTNSALFDGKVKDIFCPLLI